MPHRSSKRDLCVERLSGTLTCRLHVLTWFADAQVREGARLNLNLSKRQGGETEVRAWQSSASLSFFEYRLYRKERNVGDVSLSAD